VNVKRAPLSTSGLSVFLFGAGQVQTDDLRVSHVVSHLFNGTVNDMFALA